MNIEQKHFSALDATGFMHMRDDLHEALDELPTLIRAMQGRIAELEKLIPSSPDGYIGIKKEEFQRLMEIEHRAWHIFDESMDDGSGELKIDIEDGNADLEELYKLLPEDHPDVSWRDATPQAAAQREGGQASSNFFDAVSQRGVAGEVGRKRSGLAQEAATIKQSLTVDKDFLTTEEQPTAEREGWKWVPVEPTREQQQAGVRAAREVSGNDINYGSICAAYRAMITAAPTGGEG